MAIALLHGGASLARATFSVHPSTVIGIVALVAVYEWAARAPSVGARDTISRGQRLAFHGGLLVMFFTLNGPLHDLSDQFLFSAHMVQHLMLAFAIAPLLVMGTPGAMLRPVLRLRGVSPLARWLTAPVHAFAIFNVVMAGWHLPALYNYALAHHPVHIVQHLCFLVASTIMWWPVMSTMPELPRLSYPKQMLYLFVLTFPMTLVAVIITYADTLLYPLYASAPRVMDLSPIQDQRLGGLIMWIPGGLIFVGVLSVVFFKWVGQYGEWGLGDGPEPAIGGEKK